MERLADAVLTHRRAVALFWLLALAAGGWAASGISGRLSKQFAVPGAASYRTNQEIGRRYGTGGGYPDVVVISAPPARAVTSGRLGMRLRGAFVALERTRGFRVASFFNTGDRRFVSADGHTTFAVVFVPFRGELDTPNEAPGIVRSLRDRLPATVSVGVTGIEQLSTGGGSQKGFGVLVETLLAGIGALAVLAFVFGSLLALVPLLLAIVSILSTFLLIDALTVVAQVSLIVEYLVALIGLGVAIDYSLLIVTRWREELAHGHDPTEAVRRAIATAGRAVAFSGVIVAIGLMALVLVPAPAVRSVGYAGMLTPLIGALTALTLLPVILSTIGARADWPHRRTGILPDRGWSRWGRFVIAHRWVATLAALAILAGLGATALQLRVGQPDTASLAQTGAAAAALHRLEHAGIAPGVLTPIEVLTPRREDPATVAHRFARAPGIRQADAPADPAWRRQHDALLAVLPTAELSTTNGRAALGRVRAAAARIQPTPPQIGGAAALTIDETHTFYDRFPLVLALIALTTYALLTRAFRSILLPAKAIVLNLASVAATYGVLVLVWQQGHGSHAIWGTPATGAITNWVPLIAFAFLFGLSMDYEVFILTRIREEYDHTGDTNEAIVTGIGRTGRLVTSAALILFLAFASLSTGPQTDLRIMATALGAGILLDATVVRAILVPALTSLLGPANWWLPGWARPRMATPSRATAHRDAAPSLHDDM